MNKTKILSISVFVFMSVSCSVQRGVTYSARTEQLSPQIIQMPTVTELDVSENPVIADTVVNRHLFKKSIGYQSKKDLTDALIASILKKSGSDILMEPNIKTEITQSGFSSSTLKVVVRGYPAKYKNFRTITLEDVDVLNALKKEKKSGPISYSKFIRSNAGQNFLKAGGGLVAAISNAEGFTQKSVKPERTPWRRSIGYTGIYEFGCMVIDFLEEEGFESGAGIVISTSQGVQIKPWLFLGGSIGANIDFEYDKVIVPLAVSSRFYVLNRRVSPFWSLKLGVAPVISINKGLDNFAGYIDAGFGVSIGSFNFGLDMNYLPSFDSNFGDKEYMSISIGLAF